MSRRHTQAIAPASAIDSEQINKFDGSYDDPEVSEADSDETLTDDQFASTPAQTDKPKTKRPRKPKTPGLNKAVLILSDDDYRSLNEITTFRKSRLLYPNGEPIGSPNEGCTPFGVVLAQICREWFEAVNFRKSV
jgi:hypothetical protein